MKHGPSTNCCFVSESLRGTTTAVERDLSSLEMGAAVFIRLRASAKLRSYSSRSRRARSAAVSTLGAGAATGGAGAGGSGVLPSRELEMMSGEGGHARLLLRCLQSGQHGRHLSRRRRFVGGERGALHLDLALSRSAKTSAPSTTFRFAAFANVLDATARSPLPAAAALPRTALNGVTRTRDACFGTNAKSEGEGRSDADAALADSGANDIRLDDMELSVTWPTFADFCAGSASSNRIIQGP